MGARSVINRARPTKLPVTNRGVPNELLDNGASTRTSTTDVDSEIVAGLSVTTALRIPTSFRCWWARRNTAADVAPGMIASRAATYAAWSIEWRIIVTRVSSIPPKISNTRTVKAAANSTVAAPRRDLVGRSIEGFNINVSFKKSEGEHGEKAIKFNPRSSSIRDQVQSVIRVGSRLAISRNASLSWLASAA